MEKRVNYNKVIKDLRERNHSLNNQLRLKDIRISILEHRIIEKDKEIDRLKRLWQLDMEGWSEIMSESEGEKNDN